MIARAPMLATTIDVPAWVAIVGTTILILSTVIGGVVAARQVAIKQSLEVITAANVELRLANADLHSQLADEREKRAALEGRLDAITGDLADQIIKAVADTLARKAPR